MLPAKTRIVRGSDHSHAIALSQDSSGAQLCLKNWWGIDHVNGNVYTKFG